ncbi:MAG: ubiquinol-cytochrome c reductase iron-sulfur subunit [Pseudomonadota bacterium]
MSNGGLNLDRRQFLTLATTVAGGAGAAAVAVPFIASFNPSTRAQGLGAPVEVDIARLEEGEMLTVEWRGKPVYVVKRPAALLESLDEVESRLKDPESTKPQQPEYAANKYRSIKPEILVLVGVCTHLGCAPLFRPEVAPADLGDDWPGGFFCPCHGSKFDLSGRVYAGVPAQDNLPVPPYRFESDSVLTIGEDQEAAA